MRDAKQDGGSPEMHHGFLNGWRAEGGHQAQHLVFTELRELVGDIII